MLISSGMETQEVPPSFLEVCLARTLPALRPAGVQTD